MTELEREEKQALEEKIAQYEDMLSKVLQETLFIGHIVAGPDSGGLWRVLTIDNKTLIIPTTQLSQPSNGDELPTVNNQPEVAETVVEPIVYKIGDKVLCTEKAIVNLLPEELEIPVEHVNFTRIDWSEVGGFESQVGRIRETLEHPIKYAKQYEQLGLKSSKGVLLYGPPGCGKTMIARAIASMILPEDATNDQFIYVKGGELLNKYVGETERMIKAIFDRARFNLAKYGWKTIIFIDEADAIVPVRGSRRSSDVETTIVPTFLSEMDGFQETGAFVILATNYKSQIDPAVIRPGRIDLCIEIGRPTTEDALKIFHVYYSKTKIDGDIAELCVNSVRKINESDNLRSNISGAMINGIVQDAGKFAVKRVLSGLTEETNVDELDIKITLNDVMQAIDALNK